MFEERSLKIVCRAHTQRSEGTDLYADLRKSSTGRSEIGRVSPYLYSIIPQNFVSVKTNRFKKMSPKILFSSKNSRVGQNISQKSLQIPILLFFEKNLKKP